MLHEINQEGGKIVVPDKTVWIVEDFRLPGVCVCEVEPYIGYVFPNNAKFPKKFNFFTES